MKDLTSPEIHRLRDVINEIRAYGKSGYQQSGMFNVQSPTDGQHMVVVASSGAGWEHVSVSRSSRCPNWPEMDYVKRLFFLDTECVMQLHPPIADYVTGEYPGRRSIYCLHLWRPTRVEIPRP